MRFDSGETAMPRLKSPNRVPETSRRAYSAGRVARLLGVSMRVTHYAIRDGRIPAILIDDHRVAVPAEAIPELVKNPPVKPRRRALSAGARGETTTA
jgi:hypothetical protein